MERFGERSGERSGERKREIGEILRCVEVRERIGERIVGVI